MATAISFAKTRVDAQTVSVGEASSSRQAGRELAAAFDTEGLAHLLVLSDGLLVNGSELVAGLSEVLPPAVTITGGLSADGDRFSETLVIWGDRAASGRVVAIGLYGEHIEVGYGSLGGWDPFGPERLVTKSDGNILYELDGRSALDLYKRYLGEHADGLPATGLRFPLSLRTGDEETAVVRTVLAVDEANQSMTFAGDLPEGAYARLMKANFNRLIDGAMGAARESLRALKADHVGLAILISCVGRRMVLGQRTEEELDAVREALGDDAVMAGFYSYGEISPFSVGSRCELHNQTMTITTLSET